MIVPLFLLLLTGLLVIGFWCSLSVCGHLHFQEWDLLLKAKLTQLDVTTKSKTHILLLM
jgi:hypothetical protein